MFSSFNQFEYENNREKSLDQPTGLDPGKLAKAGKALAKGLPVAEIVALTDISRASVTRYRKELAGEELIGFRASGAIFPDMTARFD